MTMTTQVRAELQRDFAREKEDILHALQNILEDFGGEKAKLEQSQRALLNILADFSGEKGGMEASQRAMLNILADSAEDRTDLQDLHRALLNILADLEVEKTLLRSLNDELSRATERAQAADKVKSAFLATMSHELRTPLNSILGFTGIVLQQLAGPLNPEQSKQLEMVRGSARHLLALINDVLDISKIEAGELEVQGAAFDLRASIIRVVGLVAPLAEKKSLALHMQIAPAVAQAVNDQRRVEQILLNLLGNAIKFTERGEVVLAAEIISDFKPPSSACAGPAVRIRVSDTGVGITAVDLSTLFQPFRQIDSTLSRKHEGTGLGLAICRRLAERMGGKVEAESQWGKGSTFTFTLPLTPAGQP